MMVNFVSQIGKYCSKVCCDDDKRTDTATRFWPRVSKSDSCWMWIAAIDSRGYGKFWLRGRTVKAHRVAYELTYGAIADDDPRIVCHHCDTPLCCRPDHLFLGTSKENTADMIRKGRERRGITHGCAKLTEADVLRIRDDRARGRSLISIAADYGVSVGHISSIALRRIWKHL
jgi:hypothetical protein